MSYCVFEPEKWNHFSRKRSRCPPSRPDLILSLSKDGQRALPPDTGRPAVKFADFEKEAWWVRTDSNRGPAD